MADRERPSNTMMMQSEESTAALSWFCLRTAPKHEHLAAKSLFALMGVETLAPRMRFQKATKRGPVWFVEALFPSYIFARFKYAEMHRQVQHAPGVSTIVRFGTHVIPLPDSTIEGLRSVLGEESVFVFDPGLKIGDTVQITSGAFRGLEAVITQLLPAKERVKVLFEFLGRQTEVEVDSQKVLHVTPPREATLPAAVRI